MKRLDTILKAALLAGLAYMFYDKLASGTLGYYINQRFAWLTFVAVVILSALALTVVYRLIEGRGRHADAGDHDHDHDHSGRPGWATLALIAVPVLLGLLVPARPLGAGAIGNRGIGLIAPGGAVQAALAPSGPKNILDWLREFSRSADPAAFSGQAVDVVGFVYRDRRNPAGQFWVSRFTISCCVADASAIGLLAHWPQAASLKDDAWVRVAGRLGVGEFDGETLPVILADRVEPTAQPAQPYLYP